ncbi:MAG: hypothetical protein AB1716_19825 [Planctomycetota bacterium]
MPVTLHISDQTATGQKTNELTLDLLTERISVRELIRSRVYQEVKDHNVKANQAVFQGFVQPTDAERTLNGFKLRQPGQLDWKRQYEVAVQAFERNGFLILVDDRQVESLDEEIAVAPETQVSFVKLVPLVGG